MVDETGIKTKKQPEFWLELAFCFNKKVKPSKAKKI